MPKEQGHFGERAARSTSKNAKDKSNSATLRASKGGTHTDLPALGDMNSRMLRCHSEKDSEKDSGYSGEGFQMLKLSLKWRWADSCIDTSIHTLGRW